MPRPVKRSLCHPDRRHYGHGMCHKCYLSWYEKQPGNKRRRQALTKSWRAKNGERVAGYNRAYGEKHERCRILRKYGMTGDEYDESVRVQNGLCKICGRDNGKHKLVIDHCHKTGKIRGLICKKCNSALGFLDDKISLFEKCIEYLKSSH